LSHTLLAWQCFSEHGSLVFPILVLRPSRSNASQLDKPRGTISIHGAHLTRLHLSPYKRNADEPPLRGPQLECKKISVRERYKRYLEYCRTRNSGGSER
jgi:hypothetical protein